MVTNHKKCKFNFHILLLFKLKINFQVSDNSLLTPYNPPNATPSAVIKGTFGDLNKWNAHGSGIANLGPLGDDVNVTNRANALDGFWVNL